MMMLRKADDRGHFDHGWLDTYHTFAFADYVDPGHMGFRALRVINDDRIAPGAGFGTHGHRDMEILTCILEGALRHQDSAGGGGILRPGVVQRMSAGTGVRHSEHNASDSEWLHLLQIWILPDRKGVPPRYEDRHFPLEERMNRLRLIASPDGADGSLSIYQDARIYATVLEAGAEVALELLRDRHAWVQAARGRMFLGHGFQVPEEGMECAGEWTALSAGDGAALSGDRKLALRAEEPSEALIFDLA